MILTLRIFYCKVEAGPFQKDEVMVQRGPVLDSPQWPSPASVGVNKQGWYPVCFLGSLWSFQKQPRDALHVCVLTFVCVISHRHVCEYTCTRVTAHVAVGVHIYTFIWGSRLTVVP
jgi:hypothetical protein